MQHNKQDHQLTLDFTAGVEADAESINREKGKSRRTVMSGDPQAEDLSIDDTAPILRRIEEHLAAIRQQQESRSRTWLTVQDVADELQVSRDTINRIIGNGTLKAAPITTANGGGTRRMYRIKAEWLEEFLLSLVDDRATDRTIRPRRAPRIEGADFIG